MTIGIGFACSDGIVLCSDTQITLPGYAKYYERKILTWGALSGSEHPWTLAFTYAGDPEMSKGFCRKLLEVLNPQRDAVDGRYITDCLEHCLADVHAKVIDPGAESIDIICGMSIRGQISGLLLGKRTSLRHAHPAYIGFGDFSVIRYLEGVLPSRDFPGLSISVKQAVIVGVYLVEQAKKYVDGCGGDTDVCVLPNDGKDSFFLAFQTVDMIVRFTHQLQIFGTQLYSRLLASKIDLAEIEDSFQKLLAFAEHFDLALRI